LPFITKNHSVRHNHPRLNRFRKDFPHNSPSYFCFAALHGIASAHGNTHIAGIKHDCQIAFERDKIASFSKSYSEFWRSFGGVEVNGQAYLMPVPMSTRPLSEVKSKHRKRAIERRRHWSEIADSASAMTLRRKVATFPGVMSATILFSIVSYLMTVLSLEAAT